MRETLEGKPPAGATVIDQSIILYFFFLVPFSIFLVISMSYIHKILKMCLLCLSFSLRKNHRFAIANGLKKIDGYNTINTNFVLYNNYLFITDLQSPFHFQNHHHYYLITLQGDRLQKAILSAVALYDAGITQLLGLHIIGRSDYFCSDTRMWEAFNPAQKTGIYSAYKNVAIYKQQRLKLHNSEVVLSNV